MKGNNCKTEFCTENQPSRLETSWPKTIPVLITSYFCTAHKGKKAHTIWGQIISHCKQNKRTAVSAQPYQQRHLRTGPTYLCDS